MKTTSRKLRKLENINLLIVSKDLKFADETKTLFSSLRKCEVASSYEEIKQMCTLIKFDLIVIDNDANNFTEIFNTLDKECIPDIKIIILDQPDEENITNAIASGAYTVLIKPLNIINVKLAIIASLNQTKRNDKLSLGQGYYLDSYRDRVYNKSGKVVEFTKLEFGLLKLILDNKGSVVDYDMIAKNVWKGKKMSIFTMRNIVNKIRIKTYYDIFSNSSAKGYIIK